MNGLRNSPWPPIIGSLKSIVAAPVNIRVLLAGAEEVMVGSTRSTVKSTLEVDAFPARSFAFSVTEYAFGLSVGEVGTTGGVMRPPSGCTRLTVTTESPSLVVHC